MKNQNTMYPIIPEDPNDPMGLIAAGLRKDCDIERCVAMSGKKDSTSPTKNPAGSGANDYGISAETVFGSTFCPTNSTGEPIVEKPRLFTEEEAAEATKTRL